MTRLTLLGLALGSLALLHCAGDVQSLGTNRPGAGQSGSSGSSIQAGAAGTGSPGGQVGPGGSSGEGGSAGGAAGAGGDPGGAAGVAGAPPVRPLCDGSDGLTFGFAVFVAMSPLPAGSGVQHELGDRGFYVDGHCRYWVIDGTDNYFLWKPTHAGTLTAAQAQQLAADVGYDHWPTTNGDFTLSGIDGDTAYMFDRDHKLLCHNNCRPDAPSFVQALRSTLRDWTTTLYAQGTPVDTPMRVRAVALPGDTTGYKPLPWTLATPLESLVYVPQNLWTGEDAPLVTDPAELAALRQLRADIRALQVEKYDFPLYYAEQASPPVRARVFFRDTIPLENAQGRIAIP